jgi:hypothetical protein
MEEKHYIEQTYWTTQSIKNNGIAEKLANLFAVRDDEFAPTALYGEKLTKNKNEKYDKTKEDKFVECINTPDINYVVLTNSDRVKRDVIFGLRINMLDAYSLISFCVTHSYFNSDEKLQKFLNIGKEIAGIINPIYGLVHDDADFVEIMGGQPVKILEKIPGVFWGNYFGEPYISKIGKQKLLSSTVYKVEELKNGDIYLQISDTPFKSSSDEERKIQKNIAKHLGIKGNAFDQLKNIFK